MSLSIGDSEGSISGTSAVPVVPAAGAGKGFAVRSIIITNPSAKRGGSRISGVVRKVTVTPVGSYELFPFELEPGEWFEVGFAGEAMGVTGTKYLDVLLDSVPSVPLKFAATWLAGYAG